MHKCATHLSSTLAGAGAGFGAAEGFGAGATAAFGGAVGAAFGGAAVAVCTVRMMAN